MIWRKINFAIVVASLMLIVFSAPCASVTAADDMPTFTDDDFSGCQFGPGLGFDYADVNTYDDWTYSDAYFGTVTSGQSYLHINITYYRTTDAAAAEFQRTKELYLKDVAFYESGGVDGRCRLISKEESGDAVGFLSYGPTYHTDFFYYLGKYYMLFDQHYFALFELSSPVEKMTEEQAKSNYSLAKECLQTILNKKDRKFWGTVTNAWGKELPGMVVKLTYGGKEYETTTDENGAYKIPFTGTFSKKATLSFLMQCYDAEAGKVLFTINNDYKNDAPFRFDENFMVTDDNDLKHDFTATNDLKGTEFMGYVYYKLIQAIAVYVQEFGEEEFASIIQEVIIRVYATDRHSFYEETRNSIVIRERDTVYTDYVSLFRPPELEFHEYSHHVMKSYYGNLPPAPADAIVEQINHGGYMNPSTADSFVEGFAIFMAQIIREKAGYNDPGVDYLFGSLEVNTRAWDGCGSSEDMAAAGIFWDLYDGADAADNDTVQLTLQEIWGVLKTSKKNMFDVYQKFVNDFPVKKAGIDRIFINHGFFADTDKGNGTYDQGEPLRGDIAKNDYFFIDLANPVVWDNKKKDGQVLAEKETIGQATNYERPDRFYPPPRPYEFIKTDGAYPFYKVSVSFSGSSALNYELISEVQDDGLIPVSIPPASYQATITVEGYGQGVTTAAPLTFTNSDYQAALQTTVASGYYKEHDFQITGTAPQRPVTDPALTNPGASTCVASTLLGNDAARLETLRQFRDEVLSKSAAGKKIINVYYTGSAKIIPMLDRHPNIKKAARALLEGVVSVVKMFLK